MNIVILGIDLGKNLCSVVGVDETARSCFAAACATRRWFSLRQAYRVA